MARVRRPRSTDLLSRQLALVATLVSSLLVGGCGTGLPTVPTVPSDPTDIDFADSVSMTPEGSAFVWTVSPWPLAESFAFLCPRDPGGDFADNPPPSPPAEAGCVQLEATTESDVLRARFDSATLDPEQAADFETGPPWFLAVAGSRGGISASTVLTVIDSPLYSPPGSS
jgi:hypothetical protein